ncbi:hypothetical protein AVEN_180645-1 [Araneus ventricosus]|uniref:Uncharacterized protein n=1 Tax=Araneus ventricosus TaxID=182803 RepID=A0A4Y2ICW3_ARAVE|nr:hypothetical protein AVEN_180645-1 [Araneus ventricosus]
MAEGGPATRLNFDFVKRQADNIISAKISDPSIDKQLHDVIMCKNVIHGLYGPDNIHSLCMKKEKIHNERKETVHNETDIASADTDPQQREDKLRLSNFSTRVHYCR